MLGGIFGIGLGFAQWTVLRSRLRRALMWVGATVVGFAAGAAIIFGFMDGSNPDTSLVMKLGHAVVLGGALGVTQWVALRRKVDEAYLWIFVNLLAWTVAEVVGVA